VNIAEVQARKETLMPDGELSVATIAKLRTASQHLEAETATFTRQLVRIPTENPKLAQIEAGAELICQDVIEAPFSGTGMHNRS